VSRRRPGRLWLFFYGRKRRGFPGLLVALIVAVVVLGALYGLPNGADLSRLAIVLTVSVLVLLILGALVLVAIAALRPPRRGRR
jgi:peptidoglycan/LPS O-acetylase OafA/YrhL